MEEDEFLTANEVAERLRMHRNIIYRMMKLGQLKGYHIRGRICFRRTDIEQLLGGLRVEDPGGSVAEKQFLTVNEAANLLLVHTSIIRRMVREGRLKLYPIGESLYLKREDVHALLKG
jgi:excisionase family DNA binding protein